MDTTRTTSCCSLRKTRLCPIMFTRNGCKLSAEECRYAHDKNELRPLDQQYFKISPCAFYAGGKCRNGDLCTFAHGTQDLVKRAPPATRADTSVDDDTIEEQTARIVLTADKKKSLNIIREQNQRRGTPLSEESPSPAAAVLEDNQLQLQQLSLNSSSSLRRSTNNLDKNCDSSKTNTTKESATGTARQQQSCLLQQSQLETQEAGRDVASGGFSLEEKSEDEVSDSGEDAAGASVSIIDSSASLEEERRLNYDEGSTDNSCTDEFVGGLLTTSTLPIQKRDCGGGVTYKFKQPSGNVYPVAGDTLSTDCGSSEYCWSPSQADASPATSVVSLSSFFSSYSFSKAAAGSTTSSSSSRSPLVNAYIPTLAEGVRMSLASYYED